VDHALRPAHAVTESSVPLRAFVTLVLWLGCVSIGVLGLVLPYPRQPSVATPTPIFELEIPVEQLPVPSPGQPAPGHHPSTLTPSAPTAPTSLPPFQEPPASPRRQEVLTPKPLSGFTISADAPLTAPMASAPAPRDAGTVGTAPAVSIPPSRADSPPAADILAQPAPEYPRAARQAGQEGEVRLVLTVGTDGRITQARIQISSRWPLLDREALRTVREKWRFAPGTVRQYEVPIQFHLRK